MNQGVVDYLQQNKDKYPKEVLIEELKKAGYSDLDIIDSAKFVFANESIPSIGEQVRTSFWDFKSKKVYTKPSEKWKDFLFGLFAPIICASSLLSAIFIGGILLLAFFVFEIIAIIHLYNRRRFIVYGLILNFTISFSFIIFILIRLFFSRYSF